MASRVKRKMTAGPRFGAHMSVAGGMHNAIGIAAEAGCDCLQVFVKNQRQWQAKPLSESEVSTWSEARAKHAIHPVVAHATYLINFGTSDESLWRKSIDAFVVELDRCTALGIEGLVVHPGAHLGAGEAAGCARIAAALDVVADRTPREGAKAWLEITAGQGSSLGCRFEHIRDIIGGTRDPGRLGVCFDTCHALAAGYRFDDDATYATTFGEFERIVGLERLRCFHLNDSLRECGSRVDRHAHIGKGHVGREAFRRIVNDPRFQNVPMILETPKGKDARGRDLDRVNLAALRRMIVPTS